MGKGARRHHVPTIEHPKYMEALELCYAHINRAEEGSMVLVTGMSGSGKGTIAAEIVRRLTEKNPMLNDWDMPIVEMIATNSENAYYSSKDTVSRLLNVLKDPFHSVGREEVLEKVGIRASPASHRSITEGTMRQRVTRLLKGRNVRYLIIDEADMMCVIKKSGRDEADHLESWRLLALDAEVVIVFLATFRILKLWDRTSQFTRKMPTVHVQRYVIEIDEDVESFVGLIEQMCDFYRIAKGEREKIIKNAAAIMTATGGVFGQLKGLFDRADERAEAMGRKTISLTDISYALPRRNQVKRLWVEIDAGERALESSNFEELAREAKAARLAASKRKVGPDRAETSDNADTKTDMSTATEANEQPGDNARGDHGRPSKGKGRRRAKPKPRLPVKRA